MIIIVFIVVFDVVVVAAFCRREIETGAPGEVIAVVLCFLFSNLENIRSSHSSTKTKTLFEMG